MLSMHGLCWLVATGFSFSGPELGKLNVVRNISFSKAQIFSGQKVSLCMDGLPNHFSSSCQEKKKKKKKIGSS
jgi:hypothetical protein